VNSAQAEFTSPQGTDPAGPGEKLIQPVQDLLQFEDVAVGIAEG